jgi:hypothetical protein
MLAVSKTEKNRMTYDHAHDTRHDTKDTHPKHYSQTHFRAPRNMQLDQRRHWDRGNDQCRDDIRDAHIPPQRYARYRTSSWLLVIPRLGERTAVGHRNDQLHDRHGDDEREGRIYDSKVPFALLFQETAVQKQYTDFRQRGRKRTNNLQHGAELESVCNLPARNGD